MLLSKLRHDCPIYIQNPRYDEVVENIDPLLPPTKQNKYFEKDYRKEFYIADELGI